MTRLPELLTTGEVASALSVDVATVRRWIASGKLPAVPLPSGHFRVRTDVVESLLAAGAEQPSESGRATA